MRHIALLVPFVFAFSVGCSSPTVQHVEAAAIDCTKGELGKLEAIAALLEPLLEGGVVQWKAVETAAINAGADVGGCLLAHLADKVPQVKSLEGPAAVELAIAHLRAATRTNATYRTSTRAL